MAKKKPLTEWDIEVLRIVKAFGVFGITDEELQLVLTTIQFLKEWRGVKSEKKLYKRSEINFIRSFANYMLQECTDMMWKKGNFHQDHVAYILNHPRNDLYIQWRNATWGIKKDMGNTKWHLDKSGEIKRKYIR